MTKSMKTRILLVEDELPLLALLRYNLEKEGYDVEEATDGDEALIKVAEYEPDLILLDWMLPRLSGLEVCRQLRRNTQTRNIPVIMLTARSEENDKVRGLEAGADDYVSKPFSPNELLARVRAVLRRIRPALAEDVLTYGGLVMDLATYKVTRDGRSVHLGPTEFKLLKHFLEHPGRVLSRDHILNRVWGNDINVELRTVDVHIRRLRIALNEGNEPDVIRTVRAAGYALEIPAPAGGAKTALAEEASRIS